MCSASLNTKSPVCTSSTPLYGSLVTSLVRRKMFSRLVSVRTSLPRSKTSTAARLMTRCVCFSCPCNQMVKVLSRHLKKKKSIWLFSIFNVGLQSKIVRVLNLWQKNNVFKSDIIQPLLDMAAGLPPPSVMPISSSSAVPINSTTPGKMHDDASSVKQYTVVATCFILGLH